MDDITKKRNEAYKKASIKMILCISPFLLLLGIALHKHGLLY